MININRNLLFKGFVLALCIISSVHIFLFPLNETYIRTYSDLEPTLCCIGIQKIIPLKPQVKCPQHGIITVRQGGRLGYQIWEYASVWALARKTGLEPYIPRCIKVKLELIFDKLSVPNFDEISHCRVKPLLYQDHSESIATFDAWDSSLNQTIILQKYTKQPELISTWVQDIVQEFSIRKSLLQKSQKVLHSAIKYLNKTFETFIGVHVRKTDYLNYLNQKYNRMVSEAPVQFFLSAMNYYERKYPTPVFIFISDTPTWCWNNFKHMKNIYVPGKYSYNSPTLDMAILASCNHSIFDYGTFGEWGSTLAGGETIFYNLSYHFSARYGTLMENWHTL